MLGCIKDGATAHTAASTMSLITECFEDRVISIGRRPPTSPDLTPPDFFLWGFLKDKVYRNKPATSEELKFEIEAAINGIDEAMLQNVLKRLHARQSVEGGNFQHFQ